jgi:hypothetical protein
VIWGIILRDFWLDILRVLTRKSCLAIDGYTSNPKLIQDEATLVRSAGPAQPVRPTRRSQGGWYRRGRQSHSVIRAFLGSHGGATRPIVRLVHGIPPILQVNPDLLNLASCCGRI